MGVSNDSIITANCHMNSICCYKQQCVLISPHHIHLDLCKTTANYSLITWALSFNCFFPSAIINRVSESPFITNKYQFSSFPCTLECVASCPAPNPNDILKVSHLSSWDAAEERPEKKLYNEAIASTLQAGCRAGG